MKPVNFERLSSVMSKAVNLGIFPDKQEGNQYVKNMDILQQIIDEYNNKSITVYDLTQFVCGQLPEDYSIEIYLENGAGWVRLYCSEEDFYIEEDEEIESFEQKIVDLVNKAIQNEKGELQDEKS